ncbi:MAG: glycoside hydrolase family 1 protein [Candidatus Omnitrophota bacterium]
MSEQIKFPDGFFWGAATSSHQVEGNNRNNDWWEYEIKGKIKQASGLACRSYELFADDFDIAKTLNHNAHRLSVEWSRIEPEEGKFSEEEINHYRKVIFALRERGLEPVVTLHHFTSPLWFSRKGGWVNPSSQKYFLPYCEKITSALADQVRFWITINEPLVYAYHSYLLGLWPPQEKSILKSMSVVNNFVKSHIKAYRLIHGIYKAKALPRPSISVAQNLQAFVACSPTLRNKFAYYLRNKFYNLDFIERLLRRNTLDFIGINYYGRNLIDVQRWNIGGIFSDTCQHNHHPVKKNSLGWEIYPEGLYELIMQFKRYGLPIMITENGICTQDDTLRWEYISDHLENVFKAMQAGSKVIGYLYWSLLDNFEWDKGFEPHFGLVEVDYGTFRRNVRESAKKFAEVCKTGVLNK